MMRTAKPIILASRSPRRIHLLHQIGLSFTVQESGVDEHIPDGIAPEEVVRRLSLEKASRVAERLHDGIVIGADTIVVLDGKILGKHHGYPFYTIGQRKGLEVAVGHPLHVNKINPEDNSVTLGERSDLMKNELIAKSLNLMKYEDFTRLDHIVTKVRYKDHGSLSKLEKTDDIIHVRFDEDVSAITPGQSAVFYEGGDVVGGGILM